MFSMLSILILLAFSYVEFDKMLTREKKEYSSGSYSYNLESLGEISMSKFNDTFDFIIGVQNDEIEDFDITDNKYISI